MPQPTDSQHFGVIQPAGFPGLPEGWKTDWETFAADSQAPDSPVQLFGAIHHAGEWSGHRALFVVHGMGEHGGRYLHLPHYLKSVVDSVYCIDLRGHGRAEGLRGHVERFDQLADDCVGGLKRYREHLMKRFGKAEVHLLGHSLGGHIALRMLLTHPDLQVASATISAPLLGVKARVPVTKKIAAFALSKTWGSLQLNTELNVEDISHDKAVQEAYRSDRLVHSKMTPKFYTELVHAMSDTMSRDSGISQPVQFLIPMVDHIVDAEKSLKFARALKSDDKQIRQYDGFFHEPMNEIGKEQVFSDIAGWIGAHS